MEILPELTSEDLKEIGIKKLGHRKIILKAISEIHMKLIQNLQIIMIKKTNYQFYVDCYQSYFKSLKRIYF